MPYAIRGYWVFDPVVTPIQQRVKAALDSASLDSATRNYPNVAPDSPTLPYIVYFRVSNSPENTLGSGIPIENSRIQIDCYAATYAGAQTLATQVVAAMDAADFTSIFLMDHDMYEDSVKRHRVSQDFSVWS